MVPVGQVFRARRLLRIHDWNPIAGPKDRICSMESFLGYTNHCEGMLVEFDSFSNDIGIAIELSAPQVIADYNVGSRAWAMFVCSMEETSERRLHAQYIEVVAGHGEAPTLYDQSSDF